MSCVVPGETVIGYWGGGLASDRYIVEKFGCAYTCRVRKTHVHGVEIQFIYVVKDVD